MKNRAQILFLLTGISLLGACTQNNSTLRYRPAPTSNSETGYNVADLSEADARRLENAGATLRVLNAGQGMYEVIGLTSDEIKNLASPSLVEKNTYITMACPEPTPTSTPASTTGGQSEPSLPFCKSLSSTVQVKLSAPGVTPLKVMKRKSESLSFSLSVSPATKMEYTWMVQAPGGSSTNGLILKDQPLSFQADTLGAYTVLAIVKLPELGLACWTGAPFGVTDNVKYAPDQSSVMDEATKLLKFPHLAALDMPEAWAHSKGKDVVIAVVDSGVNFNHPNLVGNMKVNSKEISGNNVDDDGNGLIDDVVGWDFSTGDNNPYDDNMHGTHVAGLAGSTIGVAPESKILPVKVMNAFGGGDPGSVVAGIVYAVDAKADIINLSLGFPADALSPTGSQLMQKAIDYAEQHGVLVVVAAGNNCDDIDVELDVPASFTNDNVLTVAATDFKGTLTDYTNFGGTNVDIAAPGGSKLDGGLNSAAYENKPSELYIKASGTSMASPVTAGAAALLLSKNRNLKPLDVKKLLMNFGKHHSEYLGKVRSERFLDPVQSLLNTTVSPLINHP